MEKKELIKKFYKLRNTADICKLLNISQNQLKYILFVRSNNYVEFSIKKKNGGYRKINAPKKDLKKIQRQLLEVLYNIYEFSECQQGFIKEKNIVTNAKKHIGANYILNLDLKDFFNTINFGRVRGLFLGKPFNFNNEVATILAKIVTNENTLPQGAPTSPIISNMICYILDNNIEKYCKNYNCNYTRYADDITISTRSYKFPKQIAKKDLNNNIILGNRIIKIIEEEAGFIINKNKTKFSEKMKRQEVTGIIINEKINVKRIYIRNLRAILYNCKKNGIEEEARKYFKNSQQSIENLVYRYKEVVKGKLNFLRMVKGEYDKTFLKYAKEYNEIVGEEIFNIDIIKENREYIEERTGVIQSLNGESQGTIQFTQEYGAITSAHVYINENCLNEDAYRRIKNKEYIYPIKFEDLQIFNSSTNKDRREKAVPLPNIKENNIELDVIQLNIKNDKYFKLNCKDELEIGKKVIIAGYGEFYNFDKSSITIQKAEIIAEREIFGIKTKCINSPVYHGMSGGPVLNENREVIGIIYHGGDYNDGLNNAFIPIKNIMNILEGDKNAK